MPRLERRRYKNKAEAKADLARDPPDKVVVCTLDDQSSYGFHVPPPWCDDPVTRTAIIDAVHAAVTKMETIYVDQMVQTESEVVAQARRARNKAKKTRQERRRG